LDNRRFSGYYCSHYFHLTRTEALALSCTSSAQLAEPPVADTDGATLTATETDAVPLQPLASVIKQEYKPLFAALAFGIVGLAAEELNPPGPDHTKVVPPEAVS
jgi:hypothetical protein